MLESFSMSITLALVNASVNPEYSSIKKATRSLVFFGTPHAGGSDKLVTMGRICSRIVTTVSTNPSNDILEAVTPGSLFSDVLDENFRHQLLSYKIVSFYEGIGNIVPRDSAVIGLPGCVEAQLAMATKHSDMCRFDPSVLADQDNFKIVNARIRRLYREVVQVQVNIQTLLVPRLFFGFFGVVYDIFPALNRFWVLDHSSRDWCNQSVSSTRIKFLKSSPIVKLAMPVETEILDSLRFEEMTKRYGDVDLAHRRTFKWIFEGPDQSFVQWLRDLSEPNIYWISGKPGPGKSTLMKYAFQSTELRREVKAAVTNLPFVLGSFFFHDRGSTLQKLLTGLLRSILHHILLKFRSLVPDIIPMPIMQNQPITHGLDEFEANHYNLVQLIKELSTPRQGNGLKFKFCIASREWNVFQDGFKNYPGLRIQEKKKEDISFFTSSRLEGHERMQEFLASDDKRGEASDLIEWIAEKAQGVFIWVKLVADEILDGLTDGDNLPELRKRLENLPQELEKLYERIILKIKKSSISQSLLIFDIFRAHDGNISLFQLALAFEGLKPALSCPVRAMNITERNQICKNMERKLKSRCGGLLEIMSKKPVHQSGDLSDRQKEKSPLVSKVFDPERGDWQEIDAYQSYISYIHQTVKEFFNRTKLLEGATQSSSQDQYECLLASSVRFIKITPRFQEAVSSKSVGAFHNQQIITEILKFAQSAEKRTSRQQTSIIEELDRTLTSFLPPGTSWCDKYLRRSAASSVWNSNLLGLAIYADLFLFVKAALFTHTQTRGRPLLWYAVSPRQSKISYEMVELLVKKGAGPNDEFEGSSPWKHVLQTMRFSSFQGPQAAENENGYFRLLELLLKFRANPNAIMDFDPEYPSKCGYTPLQLMIELFPTRSDPVFQHFLKQLMEQGADLEKRSGAGHTPLDFASPEITAHLLKYTQPRTQQLLHNMIANASQSASMPRASLEGATIEASSTLPRPSSRWRNLKVFHRALPK
ncbi:hypothetical protein B0J14DRAFT_645554 [Halenospora varia]|nr:hypothetical protein B0J14DRAFT_645554 [Halenospora varia]